MPKMRGPAPGATHRPCWPASPAQPTPLFAPRNPLRKLVVLLDPAALDGVEASGWSKRYLLAGLLTHDLIECLRYADDGPPSTAPRRDYGPMGTAAPGWAVLGPEQPDSDHRPLTWALGGSVTHGAILGNAPEAAASDVRSGAYAGLPATVASEQRRRDAIAAMVAQAVAADVFVTDREYLHAVSWELGRSVSFYHLDGALAIVGLYLRAQGAFVISRDLSGRATHTMNRGLFYWVGARELLPAGWRWFAACVQHSVHAGRNDLILLGQSVLQRVARTLQVRDDVHAALNRPQDNDTAEDALSSLDVVLLLLMGAVDATARVVHAVLRMSGGAHLAGWHRQGWLRDVSKHVPALAALFGESRDHIHALTILRLLRNSIHGEALPSLGIGRGNTREATLVGLPSAQRTQLLAAIDALGGRGAWGVQERIPERLHADPGVLLERLLPPIVRMLGEIMDATPVELLPGVALEEEDLLAPTGSKAEAFDEVSRQSIRWQLGL